MASHDVLTDPLKAPPTIDEIRQAHRRIEGVVHRTPTATCTGLNALAAAKLIFKCENLQKVGAFKARGAANAVLSLPDEVAARGVATHSSGNHAAALAWAARRRGISAHIVMPSNAPAAKRAAVEGYGAQVFECAPTLEARELVLAEVVERTHAEFIHPYDDPRVLAGQGTAVLELCEQCPDLDIVMAPVGGGGLCSGTAISAAALPHGPKIVGAEPAQADDARRGLLEGRLIGPENPTTIADGLRTALSPLTFGVLQSLGVEILTASEATISRAMRLLWERAKLLVEPSAAVPFAAVLEHQERFHGLRVGIILSGGNADLDHLPWLDRAT